MQALATGYVLNAELLNPGHVLVLLTQTGGHCGALRKPLVVPEAGLHSGWTAHVDLAASAASSPSPFSSMTDAHPTVVAVCLIP